jgi:hypothetical protein
VLVGSVASDFPVVELSLWLDPEPLDVPGAPGLDMLMVVNLETVMKLVELIFTVVVRSGGLEVRKPVLLISRVPGGDVFGEVGLVEGTKEEFESGDEGALGLPPGEVPVGDVFIEESSAVLRPVDKGFDDVIE